MLIEERPEMENIGELWVGAQIVFKVVANVSWLSNIVS